MNKEMKRVVTTVVVCAMLVTKLVGSDAEYIRAQEESDTYILTTEDKSTFLKLQNEYKENIIKDYRAYDVDDKKSICIQLTEREKKKLEATQGIEDVENNITFSASGDGEESIVSKKEAKNPDADDWNMKMIMATQNVKNETNKKEKIKVAVMDSGVDFSEEVNVVNRVNLVDDETYFAPYFEDVTSHGTSVAGIIADIAPDAELYSVRVLNSKNTATLDSVIEGIYWCIDNDIDIINMSLGTKVNSTALEEALKEASDAGILLLAAAGNDGNDSKVEYPAAYDEVIAVGSVDKNAELTTESATGKQIELVAPGSQVMTDGAYGGKLVTGGTSLSVAHVTGAAAIIWQQDPKKKKEFIRSVLSDSAKCLGEKDLYGNGLIDIQYALEHYKEYERSYKDQAVVCETGDITQKSVPENKAAVKTFGKVELVEGRWDAAGHKSIIDFANQGVGFTLEEMNIIKDACVKVDDSHHEKYFRKSTKNVLHGKYNYISTMRYLYKVARKVYLSSEGTTVKSCCEAFKYSPYTEDAKKNSEISKALIKAIQYMGSASIPITGTGGTITWQKQRGLRILGMVMHLVGDTYAHKTKVPQENLSKNFDLSNCENESEFKAAVRNGMQFKKVNAYFKSKKYEDNINCCPKRYETARGVASHFLQHFARKESDIAIDLIIKFEGDNNNPGQGIKDETRLAYLSKHVAREYKDENRATAIGKYSHIPAVGEYTTYK